MTQIVKYISLVAAFLLMQSAIAATPHGTPEPLDGIAAIVNDGVISQSELTHAIQTVERQFANNKTALPKPDALRKQVLEQTINRKIQLDLAAKSGITVNEAAINKAIQTIATQNHTTTDELYKQVVKQGMSIKEYRSEIHDEMLLQEVQQQEVAAKVTVNPEEIDDFMRSKDYLTYNAQEYHLEDILISLPENPSPQDIANAKQHADAVLQQLHQGVSFQSIAMAESGNPQALQGGDLGWRKLAEIPANFSNELVRMKKDQLLGPVATPNGFHIVRLLDIRKVAAATDKAAAHKQVAELLFQRKFEENLQNWITKIRSQAFINQYVT